LLCFMVLGGIFAIPVRIIEDVAHQISHRAAQVHHQLPDMKELAGQFANDVNAEYGTDRGNFAADHPTVRQMEQIQDRGWT